MFYAIVPHNCAYLISRCCRIRQAQIYVSQSAVAGAGGALLLIQAQAAAGHRRCRCWRMQSLDRAVSDGAGCRSGMSIATARVAPCLLAKWVFSLGKLLCGKEPLPRSVTVVVRAF